LLLQYEITTWLRHLMLRFSLMPITNNCSEAREIWYRNKLYIHIYIRTYIHTYIHTAAWFQTSAAMQMRSALFWDFTHHRMVTSYRRFGTTYRSLEDGTNRLSRNIRREL